MKTIRPEHIERYNEETKTLFHQWVAAILWIGIVLIPLFSILDFIVVREYFKLFFVYRITCAAFLLLILILIYPKELGKKHPFAIAIIAYITAGATISAMVVNLGGYASFYYVGILMVLVTFSTFLPLNALQATISGILLYLIYAVPIVLFSEITEGSMRMFFNNSFFFINFIVITIVQCYIETRAWRRGFNLRMELDSLTQQLSYHAHNLEKEVEKRTAELLESYKSVHEARAATILGLAKLAEYRDKDTGEHLERIRAFAKILAEELAKMPKYKNIITKDYIDDLYNSSILHDIGKVGVPDHILLKPAKLTPEEFNIVKIHSKIGGDALKAAESESKGKSFLTLGKEIAYYHHERWDGTGYPEGRQGEEIPISARIVALADVYDALRSERYYKKELSHSETRKIILNEKGKHFDPDVVNAFINQENTFEKISEELHAKAGLSLGKSDLE